MRALIFYRFALLPLLAVISISTLHADVWTDFTTCISAAGQGTTCSLPAGQFPVAGTLLIQRSNITITGSQFNTTTLYRSSAALTIMIMPASGVTNVTISWLQLDGRRYSFGTALNCLDGNQEWGELDWRVRSNNSPNGSVSYGAAGTVTIHDVQIINAPADGIFLDGCGSTVSYSYLGTNSSLTKANPQWATRGTGVQLYGNQAGIYSSHVFYSGTAGVAVHGSYQYVYADEFYSNRYEGSDHYPAGGQVYLESPVYDHPAYATSVAANTIDGANWSVPTSGTVNGCAVSNPLNVGVGGMEIYGSYHSIYNNEVKYHSGAGIGMGGSDPTGPVLITTYNPWYVGEPPRSIHDNQYYGIWVLGTPDAVQGLTFEEIHSQNNAAAHDGRDIVYNRNTSGLGFSPYRNAGQQTGGVHHICGTVIWSDPPSPPPANMTYPGTYGGRPSNNVCP